MNNQEFWNKLERIINNIKTSSNNIEVIKHEIDNINSLLNTYPGILDGEEDRKRYIELMESTYILDSTPFLDKNTAINYDHTMTPEEKINYLVQNLRLVLEEQDKLKILTGHKIEDRQKGLKKDTYNLEKDNLRDDGLAITDLLRRVHWDKKISFIDCDISDLSGILKQQKRTHGFSMVSIGGKKYIVDLSYRQFFSLTNNVSNPNLEYMDLGLFMLESEGHSKIAEQLLKYGWIEATPENLSIYLDGFIKGSMGKELNLGEDVPMPTLEHYENYLRLQQQKMINIEQSDRVNIQPKLTKNGFLIESTPYIADDYSEEYYQDMSDEERITSIVQKERRFLMKKYDLYQSHLGGECEFSTIRIMLDCKSKGFDDVSFLVPMYYLDWKYNDGHNCTIAQLNGKSYLIDCTYRQFFQNSDFLGRKKEAYCGFHMLSDEKKKAVAEQLLKYGWIEATPENIKAYMDGFEMAQRTRKTGIINYEDTGISSDEYIRRLAEHKDFPINISESNTEKEQINTEEISLQDAINEFINHEGQQFEEEKDLGIEYQIDDYLIDNPNISTKDFASFIDDLLFSIGDKFASDTEIKDTKTRIDEFNKKIYTIKAHPQFQLITSRDEIGGNLYGRVLEFLQTEQYPTGREYRPSIDKRYIMSENDLESRDYDIRRKWLEHLTNQYDIPEPISANFMVASEQFYNNPNNTTMTLDFGRTNMNIAPFMTRFFYNLGYKVNFDDVLKGGQICAEKISLAMSKVQKSKTGVQMGKESIGIYNEPCFSSDVLKRIKEYAETIKGVEKYFRKTVGMPEIKNYDEQGGEIDE